MAALERRILDALPITIYAVDLEGRITYLNRSWARFAQQNGAPMLAERGVVGASLWEAIVDPATEKQIRHAMATLSGGHASSVSWELPCSSPTDERVFLMQISAIGDAHAITGYAFSAVDITQSHRSREVLIDTGMALAGAINVERVLQEVSQQLLRTMTCDTVAVALASDHGMLALAHHSGFAAEEIPLIGERLSASWDEAVKNREVITRPVGKGVEITAPMVRGDEVIGAVTLTATTAPAPHRLEEMQRVLATVAAGTAAAIERALLTRRLEYKRRLEAVGEVSSGIAHELRNPLFGISSAAQLLRFRVKDDPVVEKNVGRILREVERLNSIVTSLLEFGRPNPLQLEPRDPDAVWDEVLGHHRGRLESKALLLHRTRASPGASCRLDPQQLAQVLLNVLVNATEAAPENSDLTLHSSMLPNGAWRCRLHNNGAAIAADALPRVFEIFFSTKPGGMGIGLALCQRIIEEHGGTISLESAPESGTAVTIILPSIAS